MSMFALINRPGQLDRACDEMSDFFEFCRQRDAESLLDPLIGIWIEQQVSPVVPAGLSDMDPLSTVHGVRIQQSVGISGLWMVCWLEDNAYTRLTLLETLVEGTRVSQETPSFGRFMPIFPLQSDETDVVEQALRNRYPQRILAPRYQNPLTGRLTLTPRSSN